MTPEPPAALGSKESHKGQMRVSSAGFRISGSQEPTVIRGSGVIGVQGDRPLLETGPRSRLKRLAPPYVRNVLTLKRVRTVQLHHQRLCM